MSETETRETLIERAEKAERAAQTLGKVVEDQCRDIARITKSEHMVREDGDADWAAIWARGYLMAGRLQRTEDTLRSTEAVLAFTKETARLATESATHAEAELASLRAVVEAVQALHVLDSRGWCQECTTSPCQTAALLAPVSSSGEAESGEAFDRGVGVCTACGTTVAPATLGERCGLLQQDFTHCDGTLVTPAPVLSGGQADGEGEATRALMKAMGCRRVPRTGVLANSFYDYCERHPRSLGYGDWDIHRRECPEARRLAGVALAARPVLSREALVSRMAEALLESDAMTPNEEGTPTHYIVDAENVEYLVGILADVLDGGRS